MRGDGRGRKDGRSEWNSRKKRAPLRNGGMRVFKIITSTRSLSLLFGQTETKVYRTTHVPRCHFCCCSARGEILTFSRALSTPSNRETAAVPESGEDLLLLDPLLGEEEEVVDLGEPSLLVTFPRSDPMALSLFSLSAVTSMSFLLGCCSPFGLILACC